MTPDQLQELERLAEKLPEAVQAGHARDTVRRAVQLTEALAPTVAQLEKWATTAKVCREAVVPKTETFVSRVRSAQNKADELSSVESIADLAKLSGTRDVLRSSFEELLRDGTEQWTAALGQLQWCQSLGLALEQVNATRSVGSKLKDVFSKANTLRPFPPQASACDQLRTLRQDADLLKADLKQLNVGKSVEEFLVALANRTALVAHINAEVLAWVEKHQLAAQLRVELRGL